jgi:hypothetical protein
MKTLLVVTLGLAALLIWVLSPPTLPSLNAQPAPALLPNSNLNDEEKALALRLMTAAGTERQLLLDHRLAYVNWSLSKQVDGQSIRTLQLRASDLAPQIASLQADIAGKNVSPGFSRAVGALAKGLAFQEQAFDQAAHPHIDWNGQSFDVPAPTTGDVYLGVPIQQLDFALEQTTAASQEINRLIATR